MTSGLVRLIRLFTAGRKKALVHSLFIYARERKSEWSDRRFRPFCAGDQFFHDSIRTFNDRIKTRENRGLWTVAWLWIEQCGIARSWPATLRCVLGQDTSLGFTVPVPTQVSTPCDGLVSHPGGSRNVPTWLVCRLFLYHVLKGSFSNDDGDGGDDAG